MSVRPRQARLLAWPTARVASWWALPGAGVVAVAVSQLEAPGVIELRVAAIALSVGAAFVIDDPAAEFLAASPTPLRFRSLLRGALVLPLVAVMWAVVLWGAGESLATALTVELAAMIAVTFAAAALAAPIVADGRGGVAAAPILLTALATAALALPERWTLFAGGPEDAAWDASHTRWALVLAVAAGLFVAAGRDRACRRVDRRTRQPRPARP